MRTKPPPPHPLASLLAHSPGGPWSLRAVARAGGPSSNTLARIIRGRRAEPLRHDAAERLARVLGVSVEIVQLACRGADRSAR